MNSSQATDVYLCFDVQVWNIKKEVGENYFTSDQNLYIIIKSFPTKDFLNVSEVKLGIPFQ